MRKGILKGALCMMLSVMMASQGIFVGAATSNKMEEIGKIEITNAVKSQKADNIKVIKSENNKSTARTNVTLNNVAVPTIWTESQTPLTKTFRIENGNYIGTIVIKNAGTLLVRSGEEFKICDNNNNYVKGSTNGHLYRANMTPGTYHLYTQQNINGNATIVFGLYPNQNNRWLNSKLSYIGGTGKYSYQYFKVNKRGAAILALGGMWLDSYSFGKLYGISHYIQKKSGSSWKTVSGATGYTLSSNDYATAYGLPAGTYRVVIKNAYDSAAILAAYKQVAANDSYGTSKKKAKTIKRKKSKKQTFLTTDSTKKAHWYKIKVTKKRTTYIDLIGLGGQGTFSIAATKGYKFKSKKIKNGQRFYYKAPKGTYYIKVYRHSKSSTGAYQLKYTK